MDKCILGFQIRLQRRYVNEKQVEGHRPRPTPSGMPQHIPTNWSFTSLKGHPTGTEVKVLSTSTYLKSATYYDDRYRVIQTTADNYKSGRDRASMLYDFAGRTIKTITTHMVGAGNQKAITRKMDYDHGSRLVKVWHQLSGQSEVLLLKNEYNELGQLVDKKLHSTDNGATFKQSEDFRYNIRGWLTSINNSQLTVNSANNDDSNDLFGMELGYNSTIGTGNSSLYNGNISGMKWSQNLALGTVKDVGYNYSYDPLSRISSAAYLKNSGTWTNSTSEFSESGYTYDQNGNITALTRKGATGSNLDILSYDYGTAGNQLQKVSDTGDKTKGFIEPTSTTGNDYIYDANGNMTSDQNKGITAITYNHLNLPVQVNKGSTNYIIYSYDAGGRKLKQQVYGTNTKTSDYAGEFFYENDTLKFINHEEGRVVMTGGTPEYQYNLKDHLGNVRMTFTAKTIAADNYSTDFESSSNSSFQNYSKTNFDLVDHTDASGTTYQGVQWLNGGANGRVGLAKSFSVMPGDQISVSAYCKYMNLGTTSNPNALITSLAAAFGVSSSSTGEGLKLYNSLNSYSGLWTNGVHSDDDASAPKVFVTILFFDRDFNLVDAAWDQVSTTGAQTSSTTKQPPHDLLTKTAKAPAAGYAYVFLSNEHSNYVDVYFDDAMISFTPSMVVQQDDYYPFGLKFNSFARENSVPNTIKLFQGQEHIDDLGLNWDSFKWRNHQPDIGRFFNVDPLAEKYLYNSPYAFSENKVVAHIEIEGLEAEWADKAKKYATQAIDKTAQSNLNAFAEKIVPGVGKLNESQKQRVFNSSANGTVAVLLSEFANGTGQEKREFGSESPITKKLVEGRVMEEIQTDFYSQVKESGMTMDQFSSGKKVAFGLEFSPDQTSLTESVDKHLNSNLSQFFVGGANVSVTPGENGSANVAISNSTSRSSLMLHQGENYPRSGTGPQKPLSTIKQTFRTVMPLDPSKFAKPKN